MGSFESFPSLKSQFRQDVQGDVYVGRCFPVSCLNCDANDFNDVNDARPPGLIFSTSLLCGGMGSFESFTSLKSQFR